MPASEGRGDSLASKIVTFAPMQDNSVWLIGWEQLVVPADSPIEICS